MPAHTETPPAALNTEPLNTPPLGNDQTLTSRHILHTTTPASATNPLRERMAERPADTSTEVPTLVTEKTSSIPPIPVPATPLAEMQKSSRDTNPLADLTAETAAHTLGAFLGTLHGPIVKIAQMAAMIPNFLPEHVQQSLGRLCHTASPMHWSILMRKLNLEWGPNWQDRFISFDKNPAFAASFGQVHRAQTLRKDWVAVKVQYPAMESAIQTDLGFFKMLLRCFNASGRSLNTPALNTESFPAEWESRLREELDYAKEAQNVYRFSRIFAAMPFVWADDDAFNGPADRAVLQGENFGQKRYASTLNPAISPPNLLNAIAEKPTAITPRKKPPTISIISDRTPLPHIVLPKIIPELCTSKVLTMSWIDCQSIETALNGPEHVRQNLSKDIFSAWYMPFYTAGMMHGDPHMGNIGWTSDRLILLDFGCIRVFTPEFVQAFCHLYRGLLTKNDDLVLRAYTDFGFFPISPPIAHALNIWSEFLLAPFLMDQECALAEVSPPDKASQNLKQLYETLVMHGGTQPPAEFLIFDRVAVILGSLLMRLNTKTNWHRLMHPWVDSFSLENCTRWQKEILAMDLNTDTIDRMENL